MVDDLFYIKKYNEAYIQVIGSNKGIEKELSDQFQFTVPGFKFMPAYKRGVWDGKIRLYNTTTNLIYSGLFNHIKDFAEKRSYELDYDHSEFAETNFSKQEALEFISTLDLPFQPRDYQLEAFITCIRSNRRLVLSPTASGKSFIIYLLAQYYNLKTLIITPTTSLVHQLADDFISYGYKDELHKIYSGKDKETDCTISITTWQSIFRLSKDWFNQFDLVIVDEAHLAKANSITRILTNLTQCKHRFGFTGTLDGAQTSAMVLTGLFGPIHKVISTSKLIEDKHLAEFKIKCIVLHYSEENKKLLKQASYQDELDFIVSNKKRNQFIQKLVYSLSGNTLILFQFIEKHGDILVKLIRKETDRSVYYIHGGVDGSYRNDIRALVEEQTDAIIIASAATFSTGINIKNLKNIIFASPSKSRIRTLQSIGRVLRKSETKTEAELYDIADNITLSKRKNYTLIHFLERLKIYQQEQFPYKIYNVDLKE